MGYLEDLLERQKLNPAIEDAVRARRAEIETILRGAPQPRFYYGGSFAKRTVIAAHFDLDVVAYFPPHSPGGPRALYETVERRLRDAGHAVVRHNVALRLQYTPGWHIDVVPGCALDETYEYAGLWSSERAATRQTSLKAHIQLARAGDRDTVRLLKLWRCRNGAPVGSFVLELAAARALRDCAAAPLADRFERVLRFLARLPEVRLVDPANSANIVTADLEWGAKKAIAEAALEACEAGSWDRVVW